MHAAKTDPVPQMEYTLLEAVNIALGTDGRVLARARILDASVRTAALLAIAGTVAAEDGEPNTSLLIRIATALDDEGKTVLAALVLEEVLTRRDMPVEHQIRTLTQRGRVQRRLAHYADSVDSFGRALSLAEGAGMLPLAHYARLGLAKTHVQWGDFEDSSTLLMYVIAATENTTENWARTVHMEALWDIAILREREGKTEESATLIWRSIGVAKRWSDKVRLVHDFGVKLREMQQWDWARRCLMTAGRLSPEWRTRTSATIELLRLATATEDIISYARLSANVHELSAEATGSTKIDALDALSDAEGQFGDEDLAQLLYTSAIEEAMRQGHQWWMEKLRKKKELLKQKKHAWRQVVVGQRRHSSHGQELTALLERDLPGLLTDLECAAG